MKAFLPCPFCGEVDNIDITIISTEDKYGQPVAYSCSDCGSVGPWVYSDAKDTDKQKRDALVAWNDRAEK